MKYILISFLIMSVSCASNIKSDPYVERAIETAGKYVTDEKTLEKIERIISDVAKETESKIVNEIKAVVEQLKQSDDSTVVKATERLEKILSKTAEDVKEDIHKGTKEIKEQVKEEIEEEKTGKEINEAIKDYQGEPWDEDNTGQ